MVWNIERGLQYGKIVRALKSDLPADIYLLQEVDCYARRTKYRNVAKSLARELRMSFVYGVEFQELAQGRSGRPALHGQAILSRYPIRNPSVLRFKHQPKDWSGDWLQPRHGGRMALVSEIETPSGNLLVYNVHLESRGGESGRTQQMEEILSDAKARRFTGPLLVAGDLNTAKGLRSPVFAAARDQNLSVAPFSKALSPRSERRQKDWILGTGIGTDSVTLRSDISASDHKPISARVTWPKRESHR